MRALSCAPATRPSALRPNRLVRTMPINAAMAVVSSRVPMLSTLMRPSDEALCRRATALRIEAKISGMTIICNRPT
ncbi:hypothetical protein D3C81_1329650 [compost metagenome]